MTTAKTYEAFAVHGVHFCKTVQDVSAGKAVGLARVQGELAFLYTAAVHLPRLDPDSRAGTTRDLREERVRIYSGLKAKLPFDAFQCVWNPLLPEEEAVTGSMADALADIWFDLATGLDGRKHLSAARHPQIWREWKLGFENHWGKHALEALAAFHDAVRDS